MEAFRFKVHEEALQAFADNPEIYDKVLELKELADGRTFYYDEVEDAQRVHDLLLEICRFVLNDETFDPGEVLRQIEANQRAQMSEEPKVPKESKRSKKAKKTGKPRTTGNAKNAKGPKKSRRSSK